LIQFRPDVDLKIPGRTGVRSNVGEGIQGKELIQHTQRSISVCCREGNGGEAVLYRGVGSNGNGV